jgi:hypothetical protein
MTVTRGCERYKFLRLVNLNISGCQGWLVHQECASSVLRTEYMGPISGPLGGAANDPALSSALIIREAETSDWLQSRMMQHAVALVSLRTT